jgi:hypothetical protein
LEAGLRGSRNEPERWARCKARNATDGCYEDGGRCEDAIERDWERERFRYIDFSNNLRPTRTQHRHTHQITDQDDGRLEQSEKKDEEVKRERGVKVRRVRGGKRHEGRREGKESRKQVGSEEEEEEGGEAEQQRQEGGGGKAKDERAGERRSD